VTTAREALLAITALTGAARAAGEPIACPPGGYVEAAGYPAGSSPTDVAIGDLNSDGAPDVVVGNWGNAPGISVLLGDGAGGFLPPVHYATGPYVNRVAIARLDPDAYPDVISAGQSGVSVYRGNGDGTLQDPVPYGTALSANTLSILDLDGDGKLDVAAGGELEIDVFLGNGDGTFGTPLIQVNAEYVAAVAFGQLDGDDIPDMVVGPAPGGQYTLFYKGNGDGTFALPVYQLVGEAAQSIATSDVNGDGKADVVLVTQHNMAVLLSHGDGTFEPVALSPIPVPGGPGLTLADFHGDGTSVAAFTSGSQAQNAVFMTSLGDGRFTFEHAYQTGYGSQALAAADLDGDGLIDAVTADAYRDRVSLLRNSGGGRFQAIDAIPLQFGAAYFAAGNFDSDGIPDLAALGEDQSVITLLGDGFGSFRDFASTHLNFDADWIETGDFDGDGKLDAALPIDDPLDNGGSVAFLRGHGDGTFDQAVVLSAGSDPSGVAAADFNGAGGLDLVLANAAAENITLLSGDGGGGFGPPTLIAQGAMSSGIVAADLDADGAADVATAGSGRATVLKGIGNGRFQSPVSYDLGWGPTLLRAVATRTPGQLDLIAASSNGSLIFVLLNAKLLVPPVPGVSTVVGAAAVLRASASGYVPVTYQWRKDGTPLSDGGRVSGAHTATLTLDPVSFADAGSYDVLVTDSCTSAGSNAASLAVEFADVPTSSPFHDDILTVATAGIAAGCGGGNYCPTSPVRRDQMAVFLLKAEHGSSYVPPTCAGVFADVPCPSPFADWVEQLAAEGVTGGCGGGNYCPTASVTRAQMAVFLLKTSQGSSYTPPPATGIFGDVPAGSFAADFIEDLYHRSITGGCQSSPLLYCPGNSVLRQQMATFLVRTFAP